MSDEQTLQTITLDFEWPVEHRFFRTDDGSTFEVVLADGKTVTVRPVELPLEDPSA